MSAAGTSTSPNEKMLEPRYFRSPSGTVIWSDKTPKDGTAMMMSTTIGSTVHTTSMSVLWVKRAGTGLALALNLTTTITRRARTSSTMPVIAHKGGPSWKATIESMIGVTDSFRWIWPGAGCTLPSSWATAIAGATAREAAKAAPNFLMI